MKTNLTFSQALEACKEGKRIAREGWNGKGMFVSYSPGFPKLKSDRIWGNSLAKWVEDNGDEIEVLPYLTLKTADGKLLLGWLASQSDMLSNDWCILD